MLISLVQNYPVARWSAMFEVMGSTKRTPVHHAFLYYMRSAANLVCKIAVQQASSGVEAKHALNA